MSRPCTAGKPMHSRLMTSELPIASNCDIISHAFLFPSYNNEHAHDL